MVTVSQLKRKTTQTLIAGFLILSLLAGVLSACTMIVTTPTTTEMIDVELTPSQDLSATQELTSVLPTEVATEKPTITLTPEPTATQTLEPTATATEVPTEAAVEFPAEVHILSVEELAEKKLYGSGFELKTDFQGIPLDLTMVTSKANLELYKQTRGCMPNQEMAKYGASAEDRMAEMVFLGHYVGYLRSIGLTEENAEANYPFDHYIADLKAGADRSYTVWGPRLDGSDGEYRVNPLAPLEYVVTHEKVDPDGNGRGTSLQGGGSSLGFQQLENSGMRIVNVEGFTYEKYFMFCLESSNNLANSLLSLGHNLETLQGRSQLSALIRYPASKDKLYADPVDMPTYNKSNGLIALCILVP